MKYKSGYKYQLHDNEKFETEFRPRANISTPYLDMSKGGVLLVKTSYAWDGPSGPTYDDKLFIYISLLHDGLYQLMRMQHLRQKHWRMADRELLKAANRRLIGAPWYKRAIWKVRLPIIMAGLRVAKGRAALPRSRKKVLES